MPVRAPSAESTILEGPGPRGRWLDLRWLGAMLVACAALMGVARLLTGGPSVETMLWNLLALTVAVGLLWAMPRRRGPGGPPPAPEERAAQQRSMRDEVEAWQTHEPRR
jgi:hypothetical protein